MHKEDQYSIQNLNELGSVTNSEISVSSPFRNTCIHFSVLNTNTEVIGISGKYLTHPNETLLSTRKCSYEIKQKSGKVTYNLYAALELMPVYCPKITDKPKV